MTQTKMKYFLYEIRESDGNDCRVYDCIVPAESKDAANDLIDEHFNGLAEKGNWEADGNGGFFFPCDCEAPEEPTDDPAECEQCEVVSINGMPCHEEGCPTYRQYKRDLKAFERWDGRDCSHGGLTIDDYNVQEFDTEEEAENACARFHSRYEI